MVVFSILGVVACGSTRSPAAAPSGAHRPSSVPPWQPEPGRDPSWQQWFTDQMAALTGADPEVVFIGDSILFAWPSTGATSWTRFAAYRPVDLGVPGDTSQNVLWRLDHGELARLRPRLAVIMIGTNDLGTWPAADVIAGVRAVVTESAQQWPSTRLVVLGLLPIDPPGTSRHTEVTLVDAALAKLYHRGSVSYIDLRALFAEPDGRLLPSLYHSVCLTGTTFCDHLVHPSALGYSVMSDVLAPVLTALSQ